MRFWRKLLFYTFLIIYAVTAPWLVLRMLGFVWHPTSFRLVKTGLVVVSTIPDKAQVFVDGKKAPRLTPSTSRELIPGEHFLRIEKQGYLDWVEHITIVSNKATVLENIPLMKAAP